ncbi:MAG: hypothetical protein M1827_005003 [Pycnora praestabilis]|nr:MAG: hypothetical protein M1827_005003 [Pycnora praestabilis]
MPAEHDFLIVGGGASGSALAYRLANSASKPSVLLVEAGDDNSDPVLRVAGDRFTLINSHPALNWGYETVPQQALKGRNVNYSRGKGLGGSTAINFGVFVRGPSEDYDRWADLVGDDCWNWKNVRERYKKVVYPRTYVNDDIQHNEHRVIETKHSMENYPGQVPQEQSKYIHPNQEDHGSSGPLNIDFPDRLEKNIAEFFDAAEEHGHPLNPDLNSGNPLGLGIAPGTSHKGCRITAASAYLSNVPKNLTILTNTHITRLVFEAEKAVGVESNGKQLLANKEVILAAGALDTPKILLLSGIGPRQHLEEHGIRVIQDLPGIGQNLQDHCFAPLTILQKPGTNERAAFLSDPKAIEAARAQWLKDQTGPLAHFFCGLGMGWFKSDPVFQSEEFKALDTGTKELLKRKTIPSYEICTHMPALYTDSYELKPSDTYFSITTFAMNPQSTGEVKLQSADPNAKLLIDPKLMSHPYDRRVAIEAIRHTMELMESPSIKKNMIKYIGAPKSKSDEDIWEHIRTSLSSSWHMSCTAKMGKPNDPGTCVDNDFRVVGIKNLRVVDMSVTPFVTNNHTQSTAYLIGETAAEKLIVEHALNVQSSTVAVSAGAKL